MESLKSFFLTLHFIATFDIKNTNVAQTVPRLQLPIISEINPLTVEWQNHYFLEYLLSLRNITYSRTQIDIINSLKTKNVVFTVT